MRGVPDLRAVVRAGDREEPAIRLGAHRPAAVVADRKRGPPQVRPRRVPHARGAVPRRTDHAPRARIEMHGQHQPARAFERRYRRPQRDVGDRDAPVGIGADHEPGRRIELRPQDRAVMALELGLELAGARVPDPVRAVLRRGDDEATAGRERDMVDLVSALAQVLGARAAGDRPDRYVPARGRGREPRAGRIEAQRPDIEPRDHQRTLPGPGVVDRDVAASTHR